MTTSEDQLQVLKIATMRLREALDMERKTSGGNPMTPLSVAKFLSGPWLDYIAEPYAEAHSHWTYGMLDEAWADAEKTLNGRILRLEYDPTIHDLPAMAEILEATPSQQIAVMHVDSTGPAAALQALVHLAEGDHDE